MHKLGVRGLREVLPAVGRFLVQNTRFAPGIAIVENAEDVPAEIAALEPETIFEAEPVLLDRARSLMGRLPFDQIDVLIVGELGKNYSGAGMDPNVIGRLLIETQPDFERPLITRLAVLDVSDESHGNIVGVGFADLTTERLVSKLDPESFRINVITSCCLERARIPITLATDRDVIETSLDTCWRIDPSQARMVVIPNTLELKNLWVSAPLEAEVRAHPHLSIESDYLPIPFREDGTLDQELLFPDSIRARRATRNIARRAIAVIALFPIRDGQPSGVSSKDCSRADNSAGTFGGHDSSTSPTSIKSRRCVRSLSRNEVSFMRTSASRRNTRKDSPASDSITSGAGKA